MGNEGLQFDLGALAGAVPVPLAHTPNFALGPLEVEPARRRIVAPGGRDETLEPLVMQALVALASVGGATLSRDDLIAACWNGRIVSDDAVNRVMSRLRRVVDQLSGGAVQIETVAKVGYRLAVDRDEEPGRQADKPGVAGMQGSLLDRLRSPAVLTMGAVILMIGVTGGVLASIRQEDPQSVVGVEPVATAGRDREVQAFASALTGDLAQMAGAMSQVSVIDSGAGKARPDFVVRVSVDRERDQMVARARLVSGADGAVLWSDRFADDAAAGDRLRQKVAMATAGAMRCGLERSARVLGDATTIRLFFAACDAVMHEDYARGRSFAQQVVERRPDVAAGWSCLALTTINAGWSPTGGASKNAQVRTEARRYALRALSLDPRSGRAYQALAYAAVPGSSEQIAFLEKGIAVEPELPALYRVQAGVLFNAGYVEASLAAAQRSLALDPTSSVAFLALERRLLAAGRTDEAIAMQAKAERLWADQPATSRQAVSMLGQRADARAALAELDRLMLKLPHGEPTLPLLRSELRWRADPAARDRAAIDREAEAKFAAHPSAAWFIAAALNRMGERERALAWLERAPRREAEFQWSILFWSDAAALRRDPRFFRAMADLGLVALWQKRGTWPDFCTEPGLRYDCRAEAARLARNRRVPVAA